MEGLEVRARSITTGKLLALSRLRAPTLTAEDVEELFMALADALVDWNLEDENGNPVPATVEGLYAQDLDFAQRIVWAWIDAVSGVDAPLEPSSPSGGPFPEASIPMEPLSVSL